MKLSPILLLSIIITLSCDSLYDQEAHNRIDTIEARLDSTTTTDTLTTYIFLPSPFKSVFKYETQDTLKWHKNKELDFSHYTLYGGVNTNLLQVIADSLVDSSYVVSRVYKDYVWVLTATDFVGNESWYSVSKVLLE